MRRPIRFGGIRPEFDEPSNVPTQTILKMQRLTALIHLHGVASKVVQEYLEKNQEKELLEIAEAARKIIGK